MRTSPSVISPPTTSTSQLTSEDTDNKIPQMKSSIIFVYVLRRLCVYSVNNQRAANTTIPSLAALSLSAQNHSFWYREQKVETRTANATRTGRRLLRRTNTAVSCESHNHSTAGVRVIQSLLFCWLPCFAPTRNMFKVDQVN